MALELPYLFMFMRYHTLQNGIMTLSGTLMAQLKPLRLMSEFDLLYLSTQSFSLTELSWGCLSLNGFNDMEAHGHEGGMSHSGCE